MRNTDKANEPQLKWYPYVWFLLFPLITLVLLHTAPWQEDNSECSEMKRCTCSADVPPFLYMIVVFEFFGFLYFIAFDPLDTLPNRPDREVEDCRYTYRFRFIMIFDALYAFLLVMQLNALVESDVDCSFAIYFCGILFFVFRFMTIIFLNFLLCTQRKQALSVAL